MKIVLATDAWHPQVNGVVRALSTTVDRLRLRGHVVELITPDQYWTVPCPGYAEIRLALGCGRRVARRLDAAYPDAVHIATEGPIGWAARKWCLMNGVEFTTSFHTRFPDYAALRTRLPADWFWPLLRRFHGQATRVMVATRLLADEIAGRGLTQTHRWPLGVDGAQFHRGVAPHPAMSALNHPIQLYVGRVAIEKNHAAFLEIANKGSKVVVGDGPDLVWLWARFPRVTFLGPLHGEALASAYTAADVFVFPSLTDTFGLVNVEALACGLPVAAFPVCGPIDIIGRDGCGVHGGNQPIGALDENLASAISRALHADRQACVAEADHYDWETCTDAFEQGLVAVAGPVATRSGLPRTPLLSHCARHVEHGIHQVEPRRA